MAKWLSCAVVSNTYFSLLTRSNRCLGIGSDGTTATCNCLIDYQRSIPDIGKRERAFLNWRLLGESSKVVCCLVELDVCLVLS